MNGFLDGFGAFFLGVHISCVWSFFPGPASPDASILNIFLWSLERYLRTVFQSSGEQHRKIWVSESSWAKIPCLLTALVKAWPPKSNKLCSCTTGKTADPRTGAGGVLVMGRGRVPPLPQRILPWQPPGKESPQLQGPQYRWEGGEADSHSSVILMPPSLDLRETASTAVGPGGPVRTQRQAGGGRKAALSTMRLAALSCR